MRPAQVRQPAAGTFWLVSLAVSVTALLAAAQADAGQASTSLRIILQPASPPASCTVGIDGRSPLVSCRPALVHIGSGASGAVPLPARGGRLEIDADREAAAWPEGEVAWTESSYRRVAAGGREYLEMTLSW